MVEIAAEAQRAGKGQAPKADGLTPDSDGTWREALATAVDTADGDSLCRAILNP